MRQGELLELKWEDVDLDGGILRVKRVPWEGKTTPPKDRQGRPLNTPNGDGEGGSRGTLGEGSGSFLPRGANLATNCATHSGTQDVGKSANTTHEGGAKHHINTTLLLHSGRS